MSLSAQSLGRHLRESEARKMLAKGYKFKLLVKNKPPLYTKDRTQAMKMLREYPGAKIVKNESVELEEAAGGDLSKLLPWANDIEFAGVDY